MVLPNIDMMLFVREIFTESSDKIFVLSASIPNTPDLDELDRVTVQMMNSFTFENWNGSAQQLTSNV